MLKRANKAALPEFADEAPSSAARAAPIGVVATRLATALEQGDVLFIAADEQRAEAVAAALRCAAPDAQILHSPSSDALPGDTGAASPSNVGRRVAALRAARLAQGAKDRPALALITTAEAAASAYPPPSEFDRAPPALNIGESIDTATFAATLEEIGYFADDRVDEPGEMAVRGQVIDLFPADAQSPVRVELDEGRIIAIRSYDPVSQLGQEASDRIEIGRVVEPAVGPKWATLFDHLPDAAIASDPQAESRRDRHVALVKDAARAGEVPVVDAARWDKLLAPRTRIDLAETETEEVPRFIEGKAPLRAFGRFAKAALADGSRIVVLGAERDLRFLAPRLAKATGTGCEQIHAWRDVAAGSPGTVSLLAMPVDRGWQSAGLIVLAASDLLGSRALGDRDPATGVDPLRGELGDIRIGDVVVHEDFGIGMITGIEPMAGNGSGGTGAGATLGDDLGDAIALE